MEILWGTDTPIQMRDPVQGIATCVQARGAYRIRIDDSRKFLIKMVGSRNRFMTEDELKFFFRNQFSQYIKSAIASYIKNSGEEILGICAAQDELSFYLTDSVQNALDEYGIRLVNFSIGAIDIPLDDPGRAKLEAAFVERRQQQILGYSWAQQQSAQIMNKMAENQGDGGMMAAGSGLGMGMAAAGVFHNLANQMFSPMQEADGMAQPVQKINACSFCGMDNAPGARFCCNCGKPLGQTVQKRKMFCPNCGEKIGPEMKFCSSCGAKL